MTETGGQLEEIRARYGALVDRAARLGIDLLQVLDPVAIQCDTGTSCCAGDGKVLDVRELIDPLPLTQTSVKGRSEK